MQVTKYTFWKLINEFSIKIPIIQRDYAQGRIEDKVNEVRKNFLSSLFDAISTDNKLDFDFVYGSLDEGGNKYLIPLDGQQRLTTLFLLHWYLAVKENKLTDTVKLTLSKFTYETRISTREFCNEIVKYGINIPTDIENNSLSKSIKNASWFFLSWEKDPSVKAMLVMLDAIHLKFYNSNNLFGRLINISNPVITFQFIDLPNFGLTDNLYIKMNARGKALTEFENFKAKFEQFLKNNINLKGKTLILNNRELTYQEYFSQKIDGSWTDLFWKFKDKNNYLIDSKIMRFISFVTEMLYYENHEEKIDKVDFDIISQVFVDKNRVDFLFASLDLFEKINNVDDFFNHIFSISSYIQGKVNLFQDKDKYTNLFLRCLTGKDFDLKDKIVLYTIIQYCLQLNIIEVDGNLKDFVRVIRNLLLRIRQQNKTQYNSNIRESHISRILPDINLLLAQKRNIYEALLNNNKLSGFTTESVGFERDKATIIIENPSLKDLIFKLEDHIHFQGCIHNLDIEKNLLNLSKFSIAIQEIWEYKNDSLITRAMLTNGDYAIEIGYCALGQRYYFGNNLKWHTILSNTNAPKVKEVLPKFLLKYSETNGNDSYSKFHNLINNWLKLNQEKDWRYYFINYLEMTSSSNNLYAWKNDFEVRNLLYGDSLQSFHINPYVRTVIKLKSTNISVVENNYGRWAEESPLKLHNGVKLYCKEEGWLIELPENYSLPNEVSSIFNITDDLMLKDNDLKDRVEIARDFIDHLYICENKDIQVFELAS